jgi:hypothetical protein
MLQEARGHEVKGNSAKAASYYHKAADLMRQYARTTFSIKTCGERLTKAKLYEELASELASGHYTKVLASPTGREGEVVQEGLAAVKNYQIKIQPLTRADFAEIFRDYRPETTPETLQRFVDWQQRGIENKGEGE